VPEPLRPAGFDSLVVLVWYGGVSGRSEMPEFLIYPSHVALQAPQLLQVLRDESRQTARVLHLSCCFSSRCGVVCSASSLAAVASAWSLDAGHGRFFSVLLFDLPSLLRAQSCFLLYFIFFPLDEICVMRVLQKKSENPH
jgi:hypothetical protein